MDVNVFEDINRLALHGGWLDNIMAGIAQYGPYVLVALFLVLWFWPSGRIVRDKRQKAAILAAASGLISLGVNQVIVHLWDRPRPFVLHPAVMLLPRSVDPSFPSDHAALVFALAACLVVISRRLGLPALVFAALVSFARVYAGEHYPSDVLAGALIGSSVALVLSSQSGRLAFLLDPALRVARRLHLA